MKQIYRNILFRIRYVNDLLGEFATLVYFMMRMLIVVIILIVLKGQNILEVRWFWRLVMIFYVFYPVYIHYFNKLFYMVIKEEV